MTSPQGPAEDVVAALEQMGISGGGQAATAWREALRAHQSVAAHVQALASAVNAAKDRATQALGQLAATAPTAAELDAAQQEVLAAMLADDPGRSAAAETKLGELLARKTLAEDQYERDIRASHEQFAEDQHTAEGELSPQARAKLAQLLSTLPAATSTTPPPASAPAATPAAASASPPPQTGSLPGPYERGFNPVPSPDPQAPPVHTEPAGAAPVAAATATGVPAPAADLQNAPIATSTASQQSSTAGAGAGYMPPPMAPGAAGMGANTKQRKETAADTEKTSIDRDEHLNGDDLLRRSVPGRI